MTPEQLAELEMHLAAGTDLPTALTLVQEVAGDRPAELSRPRAFNAGLVIGLVAFLLWLWWLSA